MTTTEDRFENRDLRGLPRLPLEVLAEGGYLLEVNRQVLHPVGLALAIQGDVLVVIDARDDSTGIRIDDVTGLARERAETFDDEWLARRSARVEALGWMVQPRGGL